MSSPFSNFDFARAGVIGFGFLGLGTGVQALLNPTSFATAFGIPHSRVAGSQDLIRLIAGRNVAGGLALLAFARLNDRRAIGIYMLCGLFTAWTDAAVCQQMGNRDKAFSHAITSLIFGSLGGYLLYKT